MKKIIIIALMTVVMVLGLTVGAYAAVLKEVVLDTPAIDVSTYATVAEAPVYQAAAEFKVIGEEKYYALKEGSGIYPIFGGHGAPFTTYDVSGGNAIAIRLVNDATADKINHVLVQGHGQTIEGATATYFYPTTWYLADKDLNVLSVHDMTAIGASNVDVEANFDGYLILSVETTTMGAGGTNVQTTLKNGVVTGLKGEEVYANNLNIAQMYLGMGQLGGEIYFGDVSAASVSDKFVGPKVPENLGIDVKSTFENLVGTDVVSASIMYNNGSGKMDGGTAQLVTAENGNNMLKFTTNAGIVIPHLNGKVAPMSAGLDASAAKGIGFYIKNGDKDFNLWQARVDDGVGADKDVYLLGKTYLYDMDGYLVDVSADNAEPASNMPIPAGFEGYVVMTLPANTTLAKLNQEFVFWVNDPTGQGVSFSIDNFGLLTGEPSTATRPTPPPTPTPTPEATTPAPEGTTPPTGNPNTGDITIVLAAMTAVSGAAAVLFARKKND